VLTEHSKGFTSKAIVVQLRGKVDSNINQRSACPSSLRINMNRCLTIATLVWVSSQIGTVQCKIQSVEPKTIKTIDRVNGRERAFAEISSSEYSLGSQFEFMQNSNGGHNASSNPSLVYLSVYVRSISSINSESMDYEVDLYLQQHWRDMRLQNSTRTKTINCNDRKVIQKVWKPDIIFTNSKDSNFQYVTIPNVLMRIEPNGNVLYVLR